MLATLFLSLTMFSCKKDVQELQVQPPTASNLKGRSSTNITFESGFENTSNALIGWRGKETAVKNPQCSYLPFRNNKSRWTRCKI